MVEDTARESDVGSDPKSADAQPCGCGPATPCPCASHLLPLKWVVVAPVPRCARRCGSLAHGLADFGVPVGDIHTLGCVPWTLPRLCCSPRFESAFSLCLYFPAAEWGTWRKRRLWFSKVRRRGGRVGQHTALGPAKHLRPTLTAGRSRSAVTFRASASRAWGPKTPSFRGGHEESL